MKAQIKSKDIIISVLVAAVAVVAAIILFQSINKGTREIPTAYLRATYAIDYNNLEAVVGDADYVFVGTVSGQENAVYKNPVEIVDKEGNIKEETTPYTNYTVDVLENIKGNLTREEAIPIQKTGGLSKDKSEYIVYEGDELPIVGGTYIFFAYAQPDGSLLLSGPVSNIGLKEKNVDAFDSTTAYKEVVEAYKNQMETERQRYASMYEI